MTPDEQTYVGLFALISNNDESTDKGFLCSAILSLLHHPCECFVVELDLNNLIGLTQSDFIMFMCQKSAK